MPTRASADTTATLGAAVDGETSQAPRAKACGLDPGVRASGKTAARPSRTSPATSPDPGEYWSAAPPPNDRDWRGRFLRVPLRTAQDSAPARQQIPRAA